MPIHYAQELLLRLLCEPFPHHLDSGTEKIKHMIISGSHTASTPKQIFFAVFRYYDFAAFSVKTRLDSFCGIKQSLYAFG